MNSIKSLNDEEENLDQEINQLTAKNESLENEMRRNLSKLRNDTDQKIQEKESLMMTIKKQINDLNQNE